MALSEDSKRRRERDKAPWRKTKKERQDKTRNNLEKQKKG